MMETFNKFNLNFFFSISFFHTLLSWEYHTKCRPCSQPHKRQTKKLMKCSSNFRNISSFWVCLAGTIMLESHNSNEPGTGSNGAFCFLCMRLEISGLLISTHSCILNRCHAPSQHSGINHFGHQEIVQFLLSLI